VCINATSSSYRNAVAPIALPISPVSALRGAALLAGEASALLVDTAAGALLGRPLRTRVRVTPAGALRGQLDGVRAVVGGVTVAGLVLHRVDVRARRVRVVPGFPPHLRVGEIDVGAFVRQKDMDAWTRSASLPVRLRFRPNGIAARAGLVGVRLGEVLVDLTVDGRRLRLLPRRVDVLGRGMSNPATGLFRIALPLPPLPVSARLLRLVNHDDEIEVWLSAAGLDQELTPAALGALRARLGRLVHLAGAPA
jgi:hypothetical protein